MADETDFLVDEQTALDRLTRSDTRWVGRIRYLSKSTPAILDDISLGFVFVMAWWSGPARKQWGRVKMMLEVLDPSARLDLVVLDIDGMSGFETTPLNMPMHGVGETTWVRDGKLACLGWVYPSDAVRVNTQLLLDGLELFTPQYGPQQGKS